MDPLEPVYDPETLDEIDGWSDRAAFGHAIDPAEERSEVPAWRRRAGAGGIAAGLALGLQEIFEEPEPHRQIEVLPAMPGEDNDHITLYFVPNNPQATVAIIRHAE